MKKLFYCAILFGLTNFPLKAQFLPNAFNSKFDFFCFSTNGSLNLKAADLNNDNKPDLVVVNQMNGNLSVFKNKFNAASGFNNNSFDAKVDILIGSSSNTLGYLKLVHLNNDNLLDIVVCTGNGNSVALLKNTSDTVTGLISFESPVLLPAQLNTAALDAADVDGDGKVDIIATNYGSNSYSVFRNTSTGSAISFSSVVNVATTENLDPTQVMLADFNGDGKVDMAICSNRNNLTNIYKNISTNGSIQFSPVVQSLAGNSVVHRGDIGDIDNDGKIDIAVSSFSSQTSSLYKNISNTDSIKFEPKVDFQAGAVIQSSRLVDLNNDGKLDLVQSAGGGSDSRINIYENIGSGQTVNAQTFSAVTKFSCGDSPTGLDFADLDNDGKVDILVANFAAPSSVSVLKYNTPLGIKGQSAKPLVTLFPNPATEKLLVSNYTGSVKIFDMNGRQVKVNALVSGVNTEITLDGLTKGVYFLLTDLNDGKALKFLVQ